MLRLHKAIGVYQLTKQWLGLICARVRFGQAIRLFQKSTVHPYWQRLLNAAERGIWSTAHHINTGQSAGGTKQTRKHCRQTSSRWRLVRWPRSIRELSIEVGVPCYSCTGLWRGYTWSIVFRFKRKDAIKLERVQNRFMRMLPEELEPRERLRRIRLYSLQRRVRGDLIEAYKGMRGNFFHGGWCGNGTSCQRK